MSAQIDDRIEQDLRAAFRAAAADVHPQATPLPPATSPARPPRRRWLVPAVAAAVVAAIAVPLLIVAAARGSTEHSTAAITTVVTSGGRATVAGVSFPVPHSWTARTVHSTDTSVTVCVAAAPIRDCAGVTLRIAVPDWSGDITPVRSPLSAAQSLDRQLHLSGAGAPTSASPSTPTDGDFATSICPRIVDTHPIDGRPAVHLSIGYCAAGSPTSADWFVTDGSLAISTPRGVAHARAAQIANGIDFSGYRHAYGPPVMFLSEPGSASTHPDAGTPDGPEPTR